MEMLPEGKLYVALQELCAHLKHGAEVLVSQLRHRQAVRRLLRSQPGSALPLGVHQYQRPRCTGDHDAVLDGKLVNGEALRKLRYRQNLHPTSNIVSELAAPRTSTSCHAYAQ